MESNMNDAIMQICNLNVSYDGKTVLHNVSMNIRRNRITAILEPSGCGKNHIFEDVKWSFGAGARGECVRQNYVGGGGYPWKS